MRAKTFVILALILTFAAGCWGGDPDLEERFPAQVGPYLRTSGPAPDLESGVDTATYQGPDGVIVLRVTRVGRGAIGPALAELPPGATSIGHSPALGVREGVTFAFAGNYHAAWGNVDWLFVVDAPNEDALATFLASYGY